MNNNPYSLKEGQRVILDGKFASAHEVVVVKFSPYYSFATIYELNKPKIKWEVMTLRLTPIKKIAK